MPVVGLHGAVEADSHLDTEIAEKPEIGIIQADGIRLHPDVHPRTRTDRLPYCAHQVGDEFMPGKQRFSAMQDELNVLRPMCSDMLSDAVRRVLCDIRRHPARL